MLPLAVFLAFEAVVAAYSWGMRLVPGYPAFVSRILSVVGLGRTAVADKFGVLWVGLHGVSLPIEMEG